MTGEAHNLPGKDDAVRPSKNFSPIGPSLTDDGGPSGFPAGEVILLDCDRAPPSGARNRRMSCNERERRREDEPQGPVASRSSTRELLNEKEKAHVTDFADCPRADPGGGAADVALQLGVGILPERRGRPDPADHRHPAADREVVADPPVMGSHATPRMRRAHEYDEPAHSRETSRYESDSSGPRGPRPQRAGAVCRRGCGVGRGIARIRVR